MDEWHLPWVWGWGMVAFTQGIHQPESNGIYNHDERESASLWWEHDSWKWKEKTDFTTPKNI